MNITNSNRVYIVALVFIFLVFSLAALFISFSNRIEGDAAFHALVSREIIEKGKIINTTSYLVGNETTSFPIAYPQVFHLIGALTYLYIGTPAFSILPVFYGVFSLFFLIMILLNLYRNFLAITMGILILALNLFFLDYSSKYFMEIGLVFSILASLAYSLKYVNQKKIQNIYVAAIFFGLSVAIKQQGIIALPIFFILLFFAFRWQRSIKPILMSFLLFLFIAAGPMIQLFYSTGSILYPGDNPPKVIQMIENPLRNMLGISFLEGNKTWGTINQGRREEEISTWRNVSNIVTAWTIQNQTATIPWAQLSGILLIILLVRVIKTRSVKDLIMLVFLTLFYCLLYFLARPRYALPLIILPSVILFYIMHTLSSLNVNRPLILFTATFFIVYTVINFNSKVLDAVSRDDYGYYGRYNIHRDTELQSLYDSIKKDPNSSSTVLSPVPYETAYYTQHTTVWANPYGAIDLFEALLGAPETEVTMLLKKYHVKYLIIYADRYMRYTNWAGINPSNGFFSTIDTSPNFNLVSKNNSGRVYEVNY